MVHFQGASVELLGVNVKKKRQLIDLSDSSRKKRRDLTDGWLTDGKINGVTHSQNGE